MIRSAAPVGALAAVTGIATAQIERTYAFDIEGAASVSEVGQQLGNYSSSVVLRDTPLTLVEISWELEIMPQPASGPFARSWQSDVALAAGRPGGLEVLELSLGGQQSGLPSSSLISGSVDLRSSGGFHLPDGSVTIELFEQFDDTALGSYAPRAAESLVSGTVTLTYVPAPGAAAATGAGIVAAFRRRRPQSRG